MEKRKQCSNSHNIACKPFMEKNNPSTIFTHIHEVLATVTKKPIENVLGKGENVGYYNVSKLSVPYFNILATFNSSSMNNFDLDHSKILLFGILELGYSDPEDRIFNRVI